MEMVPVKINVPREMAPLVDELSPEMEFERNAMMLYPFIWNVTISHGRAAELLGVSKLDLIEFYNRMGMPYLRITEEDLDEELAAYKAFKKGSSK